MPLVEARNLVKTYTRRAESAQEIFYAADNVSFSINQGETLGLVGESGSGKSTIARLLLRLLPADSGSVTFEGREVLTASPREMRKLRRSMQIVFQDPYAALNPRMNVQNLLAEPLKIHAKNHAATTQKTIKTHTESMLAAVGLDASAMPRYPHEFSGGQRQRINIARALMLHPQFLVLDEPVSALDVSVGAQVINLLRDLQHRFNLTYLFITHSMPLVRYLATNIAVMRRGKIIEIGPAEEICKHPREDYTRTLLAATPEMPVV